MQKEMDRQEDGYENNQMKSNEIRNWRSALLAVIPC